MIALAEFDTRNRTISSSCQHAGFNLDESHLLSHYDSDGSRQRMLSGQDRTINGDTNSIHSTEAISMDAQYEEENHKAPYLYDLQPVLRTNSDTELNWTPLVLKPWFLVFSLLHCLAVIGGIFILLYMIGTDHQAALSSQYTHLVSTYLPTLIASISRLIFRTVMFEFIRMLPYYRMADQRSRLTKGATAARSLGGCYHPYPLIPRYFMEDLLVKLPLQAVVIVVGLLATLKSILIGSQRTEDGWIITVHPTTAHLVVAVYAVMAILHLALLVWVCRRSTGLKWNPASPIDLLGLVINTDALSEISSISMNDQRASTMLSRGTRWRLGYWRQIFRDENGQGIVSSNRVHGIGMVWNAEVQSYNASDPHQSEIKDLDPYKGGFCSCDNSEDVTCALKSQKLNVLIHLCVSAIFSAIILIATLLIVLGEVRGGLGPGFTIYGRHSIFIQYANIFFRALPTLVIGLCAQYIDGLADGLKHSTCWSDLAVKSLPASKSLAIEYSTMSSIILVATAIQNEHYCLAIATLLGSLAQYVVVFVAGLCVFEQATTGSLLITYSKPAFYMILVYFLSFMIVGAIAWPRRAETLLRPMSTFADVVRPFVGSRLLDDRALKEGSNASSQEKFRARVLLAEHLYRLGVFAGICGHEHIGVEAVGNEDGTTYENVKVVPISEVARRTWWKSRKRKVAKPA